MVEFSEAERLNRTHKLLIDRDRLTANEAADRFTRFALNLVCGADVADSPTLQAAVLTAVNLATRVRPGAVRVVLDADMPMRLSWPGTSFLSAVQQVGAEIHLRTSGMPSGPSIAFGNAPGRADLRATFDGWCAAVGPASRLGRLSEREGCVLAGVVSGALAVSEVFMSIFEVNVQAMTRTVGISLWRPDLAWDLEEAIGPPLEYLPNELWCLGLGHLGQAYLWAIGLLPYARPDQVNLVLHDPQRVGPANPGTCALTNDGDVNTHKTRVCRRWLEARGFQPLVIERRFDEMTKCAADEPMLALCGFDGSGPRNLLDEAGFRKVVECGLGGRSDNFESMLIHALPRAGVPATTYWKSNSNGSAAQELEVLMRDHPAYITPAGTCGELQTEKASRSVAVPFVGAVASGLVVGEALRMAHGGEAYDAIDLRLASPSTMSALRASDNYTARCPRISFCAVASQN